MPNIFLTVDCDGCGKPIRLPNTKPPEKALRQLALASVELPRNVLCPNCNRVFAYPIERFDLRKFEKPFQPEHHEDPVCVCIYTKCADNNCIALVRVTLVVNVSDDIRLSVLDIMQSAAFATAACKQGHPQPAKPPKGASFDVQLEPDWNPKQDERLT